MVLHSEDYRVHEVLAEMYLQMHFLDVALEHYSQALRYVDRVRPSDGNRAARENFDNYKKNLDRIVRALADEVKQRRQVFDLRASGVSPLEKFSWALGRSYKPLDAVRGPFRWYDRNGIDRQGFGLANRALAELQRAPIEQLDRAQRFEITNLQLDLLLKLGRLQEVADALPHLHDALGVYHHQYQLLWAAAVGNYAAADQALAEQMKDMNLQKRLAIMTSNYCLNLSRSLSGHDMVLRNLAQLENQNAARVVLQKAAELHLVRGLLALEKGDVDKAAGYFQKTLDLVGNTVFFPDRPIAERYLELIRKQR
jgi:tetratricopeptide (TPR) repeat protein